MSTENTVSEPGANGSGVPCVHTAAESKSLSNDLSDCEYRISYRATEFPPMSGDVHVSRAFCSDFTISAFKSPTRPTFTDDDKSSDVYVTDSGVMIRWKGFNCSTDGDVINDPQQFDSVHVNNINS